MLFPRCLPALSAAALLVLAACAPDATAPRSAGAASLDASPAAALPSGERRLGQVSIEPAYNDQTGTLVYLATPIKSPFPTKANSNSTAPLYLIEYPPGSDVGTLNCMGVPGNCPDHDGEVAGAAVSIMPGVYGTDVSAVPGHDHLVAPPGSGGDFNIAWEVHEILFTSMAAVTHITTEAQLDELLAAHKVIDVDLGFAFTCAVVPATTYWRGM